MFSNNKGKFCPLIKKACKGRECMFATRIRGEDPNTGQEMDQEGCAVAWLPVLLIENTKAQHQTGAAVESSRNIAVTNHQQLMSLLRQNAGVVNEQNQKQLSKG